MVAVRSSTGLVDDLDRLASALESLDLRTASIRGKNADSTRDQLVRTIRSYVVPRINDTAIPLCVVFAGPTGSGKSTLINSISGLEVSKTGPIRPTTTAPVVLASRANIERFERFGGFECDVVQGAAPILDTVALIDTPDIDSTSTEHRATAETLIDNADVVVFVTSTLRYADLVPWEVLRRAASRGAPVINVLNRYSSSSAGAYVDFRSLLSAEGLTTDVVRVPEHHLGPGAHSVPSLAVRELARRLVDLARDRNRYQQDVLDRVLASALVQTKDLVESVDDDRRWLDEREAEVRLGFDDAAIELELSHVVEDLSFGFPHAASARKRRRWLRHLSVDIDVNDRIVAAVETDVRSRGLIDDDLREMVSATLPGWHEYVRRVAEDVGVVSPDPASSVLIASSLGLRDREMESFVFGDGSNLLVGRVRRELVARLQVVYTHVGERLVDRLASEAGDPYSGDLANRMSFVVARSHFADA